MAKEKKSKRGAAGKAMTAGGAVALALAVGITGAGNFFSGVLDTYAGMGEAKVVQKPGSENWDTQYYATDYSSAEEIDKAAKETTKTIAGEGITLLKNTDNTLPLRTAATGGTEQKISVFGRRSVDTVWGGTGSGSGDAGQCTPITEALTKAGYSVNDTLTKLYTDNLDKVEVASNTMDKLYSMTYYIGEFPQSYYNASVTSSYANYHDAAVVVLGRQGGEGMDFATDLKGSISSGTTGMDGNVAETKNYADGQHQLELSQEEKDLLNHVKENFDKVIVVINSANVMEMGDLQNDPDVDAILWMAYPGSRGTEALAEILNGTITPSGHTVDTWPADLTQDPTFPNATVSTYSNVSGANGYDASYMIEYEEGIYVGYRYYETAAAAGYIDYDTAVVYPFGYGMSYASFAQQITGVTEEDGKISVNVKVTNTQPADGFSGKDVVQVYFHAPYDGSVEKAEVVLAAYDKTDVLAPGESQDMTLTFDRQDMASYDYKNAGCYVLDAGTYTISLRKNSHETYGDNCTYDYTVAEREVYGQDNPRQREIEAQTGELVNLSAEAKEAKVVEAATNRFDEQNEHFVEYTDPAANNGAAANLTRADFGSSFPKAPTAQDLTAADDVVKNLGSYTPDYYAADDAMPATGANNEKVAVALRGLPYDDPAWDALLDQLSVKDMTSLIYAGNQGTMPVNSIGLPKSSATDGPAGLKQYGGLGLGVSGNFNCCGTLVAATWNTDLAEQYGTMVGNEAVQAEVDGWYAPGCDLHRTAFGGRNFEYYSEDPLISGKTCAGTVQGACNKGLTCMFKHFALNDVETHRTDNGPCVWANEQAMRELYLKAFEIAIEEPVMELKYLDADGNTQTKTMRGALGVMSSFNRIGSVWSGGCSALLTDVLRGEWGFLGTVVTDYNGSQYMNVEEGVTAGNDLMLANESTLPTRFADTKNASTVKAMRQAVKNIVYMHVNSNTVNGLSDGTTVEYGIAPWRILMYVVCAVLAVLGVVLIVLGRKKAVKTVVKVETADIAQAKEKLDQ